VRCRSFHANSINQLLDGVKYVLVAPPIAALGERTVSLLMEWPSRTPAPSDGYWEGRQRFEHARGRCPTERHSFEPSSRGNNRHFRQSTAILMPAAGF
jgi:hypothetical protein